MKDAVGWLKKILKINKKETKKWPKWKLDERTKEWEEPKKKEKE